MKARIWGSYGVSILILYILIEVIWGASGGALAGLKKAGIRPFSRRLMSSSSSVA